MKNTYKNSLKDCCWMDWNQTWHKCWPGVTLVSVMCVNNFSIVSPNLGKVSSSKLLGYSGWIFYTPIKMNEWYIGISLSVSFFSVQIFCWTYLGYHWTDLVEIWYLQLYRWAYVLSVLCCCMLSTSTFVGLNDQKIFPDVLWYGAAIVIIAVVVCKLVYFCMITVLVNRFF